MAKGALNRFYILRSGQTKSQPWNPVDGSINGNHSSQMASNGQRASNLTCNITSTRTQIQVTLNCAIEMQAVKPTKIKSMFNQTAV